MTNLYLQAMDTELFCWLVAMILGAFFLLAGIIYCIGQKDRKEIHYAIASIIEYISCWFLYYPEVYFNELDYKGGMVRLVESFFTTSLRSLNLYLGEGYDRVALNNHAVFSGCYSLLRIVANVVLLMFVGGFIVKIFEGPLQGIKLFLSPKKYFYIFSQCNEKTIALAKSISNDNDRKDVRIVFVCADNDENADGKEFVSSIGGYYISSPLCSVVSRLCDKAKGMELFLFEQAEANNLIELEKLSLVLAKEAGDKKGGKTGSDCVIKVYVELTKTPWSVFDGYAKAHNLSDKVIVNFIRTEENFALNNLLKHSIFEKTVKLDERIDEKYINALIIGGMNDRNLEMLKAILHLSQMPGYRLRLAVIDDGQGRSRLSHLMPEVYDKCDVLGDAFYQLSYIENVDYESGEFDDVLNELSDFTFAFVNAGDDILNINLAMDLNAVCGRRGRASSEYTIQVNAEHKEMCRLWNSDFVEDLEIVGDVESVYDYGFITMSDIERATVAIHMERQKGREKMQSWADYCNSEYNRHSVYARTLSTRYKVQIIDLYYDSNYELASSDEVWKKYEHMRWNMYTRTCGYRWCKDEYLDKKLRNKARVHNDLVPYELLDESEKKKDALRLTPEIVSMLKAL